MSGEDFNKASVTYCTDLQEIADILMKRHDCHTNAGYSISNVCLSGCSRAVCIIYYWTGIFSNALFLNTFVYIHMSSGIYKYFLHCSCRNEEFSLG